MKGYSTFKVLKESNGLVLIRGIGFRKKYSDKEFVVKSHWLVGAIKKSKTNLFRLPEDKFTKYYLPNKMSDMPATPKGKSIFCIWQEDGVILNKSLQLICNRGNYKGKFFIIPRKKFFELLILHNQKFNILDRFITYPLKNKGMGNIFKLSSQNKHVVQFKRAIKPFWKFW